MTRTRRPLAMITGVLAAGLLAGCGGSSFDFRQDDPIGYTACRDAVAAQLLDAGDELDESIGSIAAAAASSQSADIREVVSPPVDAGDLEFVGAEDDRVYSVDLDELLEACQVVGFDPDDVDLDGQ
ncbi:hypothetical protein [uncultured Cellulomonas sp.]|uniref:hypothetical protein n=1 Tax=uncultured Cellulomonas sp. TaxID=189682 RepID=UPI002607197A|nr:hypothetical protein [uncultured Cellulomonas sp.]